MKKKLNFKTIRTHFGWINEEVYQNLNRTILNFYWRWCLINLIFFCKDNWSVKKDYVSL